MAAIAVDVGTARHGLGDHRLGDELGGLLEVRGLGRIWASSPGSPSFGHLRWTVLTHSAASGPKQTFVPALHEPVAAGARGTAPTASASGPTVQ